MANTDTEALRQWVGEQTASLAPPADWRPDPVVALARFRERTTAQAAEPRWWRWPAWAAAAVLLAGIVVLSPAGRMAAQYVWQYLTVGRVAVVRVKPWPEGVPSPPVKAIGIPIPPIPARDAEEAGRRVRYEPRLPRPFVLAGSPRLSTTFSVAAGTVVHVADLELALRRAGVTGQAVPPEWDGAQLALHTSGLVIAEWPDAVLVQSLPLTLTAPPGFDFAAYSALILRVLGVGPEEARRLAARAGTTPPWLAPFAREAIGRVETIEEITLNSGPATLLEEGGEGKRVAVFWSVPDRVYLLSGTLSRDLAIAAANAVE